MTFVLNFHRMYYNIIIIIMYSSFPHKRNLFLAVN